MDVIKGNFGEKREAPSAVECLEEFLSQITRPAVEEETHSAVDAVVLQLDDHGISLGSNLMDASQIILILELAKLSLLEQFLGGESTGGHDGTVH